MTNKSFIKKIGNAAIKHYNKYKILPSLTIAQAILESGWGKSALAKDCKNFFGMKWVEGCGCKCKTYKTSEQRSDGSYYIVSAKFRKYSSYSGGIKGYYEFLQYPRYKNLKGVSDYKTACKLIKEDGWATSLSYTSTLISLIEQYDLTSFDKEALNKEKKAEEKKATKKEKAKKATYKIGDKVKVKGKIYGNGDGSGGTLSKNCEMYVVDLVSKERYKYYIGVGMTKASARQGWGNTKTIKKTK